MAGQLTVLPSLLAATIQKNGGVGVQKHPKKPYFKKRVDSSPNYLPPLQSESIFRIKTLNY